MIVRDMTIDSIFTEHPQKAQRLAQAMTQAGLQCAGCQAATWETLEAGMYGHGMGDAQIDSLIEELNAILTEEDAPADTITMTPRAAAKYLSILESEEKLGWGVRFEEKPGGCNGFEYVLDYSEKANTDDITFKSEGIEIHIPQAMKERLLGAEIDYVDGLRGSGFKITNPNVRSSCGCGTSHGY
jgi:iron-sulfur cluster assembly protein